MEQEIVMTRSTALRIQFSTGSIGIRGRVRRLLLQIVVAGVLVLLLGCAGPSALVEDVVDSLPASEGFEPGEVVLFLSSRLPGQGAVDSRTVFQESARKSFPQMSEEGLEVLLDQEYLRSNWVRTGDRVLIRQELPQYLHDWVPGIAQDIGAVHEIGVQGVSFIGRGHDEVLVAYILNDGEMVSWILNHLVLDAGEWKTDSRILCRELYLLQADD